MSMNLRLSASPSGTRNVFDNVVNFSTYGGSSGASGSTNAAAVTAFNSAYAGMAGRTQLIIDPGTYTSNAAWGFAGTGGSAKKLTVYGYGVTLTGPGGSSNNFGNPTGPYNDWTHHANFDTVSAGTNTITMADTSLFTAGKWVLLSAIDMQGYGFPPNPGILEFKKIASKDSVSLTFTEPLINSYKSTYPNYAPGNPEIYQGGPATVYVLRDSWDQEIEAQGLRYTDTGNLTYGSVRQMQWTDCTFDTYGPCPSMNLLFRALRCSANGFGGVEIDKCVHRMELLQCDFRAIDFQSAGINELYVEDYTATNASGTPRWNGGASKSNVLNNVSIGTGGIFRFGPMNYGAMGPTVMTNVSSPSAEFFNQTTPFSDMTEEGGGVLSFADGPCPPSNLFHHWMTPGQHCVLLDSSNNFAQSFQILDLTATGGRTYVTTTLPDPVPSTINGRSAPWKIIAHPCPSVTMTNCTGNSLFTTHSGLPAGTPFNSWTL